MPTSWVEIDLAALRHNFHQARSRLGADTCVVGVVKSDAYGHGMIPVARELVACGASFLAVSKFWEARELYEAGLSVPVLVLLGVEPAEMEEAVMRQARPVVFRLDHARMLSEVARGLARPVRIHVKVDTGMGRLGVPWEQVPAFLDETLALPGIELEGVLSHFAVADEADKAYCDCQVDRFASILKHLAERGCPVTYAHIANSAGLLDLQHAHFHMVRPGIMLYGAQPSDVLLRPAQLKPVMAFKSKILQLKDVPKDHPIGYGRTYVTTGPARIATIPVGYDDGYSRLLSNKGQVLIRGQRAPLVGRVSMNMITVDVSHIPSAAEDDEVVLMGDQGRERITADEIAQWCSTISYEVLCGIGRHHYKFFLHGSDD
jgi:alanine racemase